VALIPGCGRAAAALSRNWRLPLAVNGGTEIQNLDTGDPDWIFDTKLDRYRFL
jgi:hypothetical protein